MIWGLLSLILLIVVIILTIWLLVRSNDSPKSGKLNDPCIHTTDCNGGLVCSPGGGSNLSGSTTPSSILTCKVAFNQVCSAPTDCASGLGCINGFCKEILGTLNKPCPCDVGFTCINNVCKSIVGNACSGNSDCASGNCLNNVCGVTGPTGPTGCTSSCSSSSSCYNSSYPSNDTSCYNSSYPYSKTSNSYSSSRSRDSNSSYSSGSLYTCTDSDCSYSDKSSYTRMSSLPYSSNISSSDSKRRHSYDYGSSHDSYSNCNTKNSSLNSDCTSYSSYNSHDRYIKRGVYVTNEQNQDQTLFTGIEEPIIDIVKTDKIYLLLDNGNIAANTGISNTIYMTNKKVDRMVRFGSQIIGIKKSKLYFGTKSNGNMWNWECLKNYPNDAEFINSTNTGNFLEVLTCRGKAYLYTYSANWKDGKSTSERKSKDLRFYGNDISRYIDIDERNNYGKTNDGKKVKNIKAAGFYNNGTLVPVLIEDSFTHNRIIDNKSYFLFEQYR